MSLKGKRPDGFILMDALSTKQSEFMTRRSVVRSTILICGLMVMLMLQGCLAGPVLYEASFTQFNDAVRKTLDEQMLANLVRMRYLQSPIFLQVSSVNTSFALGGNLGASGQWPKSGSDVYGATIGGSYEERPTISFSMPESREYYGRLLAPLSADQITSLILSGFDSELVLRVAARGLNRLRNLNADYADSSKESVPYARYLEALTLIKKLRSEGIVDLELGAKAAMWSSPVAADVTQDRPRVELLRQIIYAMANDAEIVRGEDGQWQTYRFERHMALRFSSAAADSPDAQRLRELLGLEADRNNFPIVEPEMVNAEKPKAVIGQVPGALDPGTVWAEIGLRGRSMLEIMQVTSKEVQVPAEDVERGAATANRSRDLQSADFVVKSSESAPSNSSLRIKYRGNWFYVDDSDLRSRETFAMLTALFAVVGGTVPGAHPVLTLPVGVGG